MVRNLLLSQYNEILPAIDTTTEGEEDGTVQSTLEAHRTECQLLSVGLSQELRTVCEEIALLAAAVIEYKLRVKTWRKR